MKTTQKLIVGSWLLSILVTVIATIAWGQSIGWQFFDLSLYTIFPFLGLVAFSLMWSHYMASVARQILGIDKSELRQYFETTSLIVLITIVLHPSLFWFRLWRDGFGFPPNSYMNNYVAPSLRWAAFLGTISWFVFLAYELRRRYQSKSWWQYINYASDVAMIAILIHSIKLGSILKRGWFRWIWFFYGVTLIGCLAYIYFKRFKQKADL